MASTVLKEWGLRNGKNVGEMVFLLIEEDVFSKQPEDSLDDFKGFMSFRKAFEEPYEFRSSPVDPPYRHEQGTRCTLAR